jgi:hypothetical protein
MTKGTAKAKGKVKPTIPPATKAPSLKKSRPGIKIKSLDEKKDIQDKHTGLEDCISIGHAIMGPRGKSCIWHRVVLGLTEFSTATDVDKRIRRPRSSSSTCISGTRR